jgi:hypothetical protein
MNPDYQVPMVFCYWCGAGAARDDIILKELQCIVTPVPGSLDKKDGRKIPSMLHLCLIKVLILMFSIKMAATHAVFTRLIKI